LERASPISEDPPARRRRQVLERAFIYCDMEQDSDGAQANRRIPSIGQRIELERTGVRIRATVFYADYLQILVKLDDGRSRSLRPGRDAYRIIE
jgi:hypothetical protein